jgi:hypothetical protein
VSIDVIVDMRKSRFLPNDALTNFRKMSSRETIMNLVILVTTNLHIELLFRIMKTIVYNKNIQNLHLVKTIEEAYELITSERNL